MPIPTPSGRTLLDQCSSELAKAAEAAGLSYTRDDFRPLLKVRAEIAKQRVRQTFTIWSVFLVSVVIVVLLICVFWPALVSGLAQSASKAELRPEILLTALWSLALGGIGAVLNLFSIYLQLIPAGKLIASNPFEINARIVLGSLFSMVISVTILADDVTKFFVAVMNRDALSGGVGLLIPFFVGYAITLALAFMQRLITALEIAFSLEQRSRR